MSNWTIELGEFQGGFRFIRTEDEEDCYYQKHLTFLQVSGMWQPSPDHEPIEACRLTISQDGIEVIGPQDIGDLDFRISVEYQWHREPRRFEDMFTADDFIHIGDGLSITRTNALPHVSDEPLDLEMPCIHWSGSVANVTASPVVHEALYGEDVCPLYDLPVPQQEIRVHRLGADE